ncbi:MSL complex subunit 3-like isoform X2 [Porites lutea]|uniref:MSL complex subunit 3-like isoform X2 n=1 Tax=Porites lutea TaxID=51062 RepID=UPI003CC6941D
MATGRETRSNPLPKYVVGEKVLCYEPDPNKARVLYESKVLEVDITKDDKGKKVPEYFIHFNGWNRSWDRWVVEDQVLKDSENNRSLMARLHEQALNSRKKKRRVTQGSESKDSDVNKPDSKSVSEVLVQLPRTPNVAQLLSEYFQHCKDFYPGQSSNLIKEVMDGLRIYFDFTLPTLLLYNFEREQYQTVMKLVPHPAELAKETHHNDEINGKTPAEDKYGVVSSSTESSPVRQVEFSKALTSTTETKEAKHERSLRRRIPRNSGTSPEASQSATVSSTSSIPESNAPPAKRKAVEIEDLEINIPEAPLPSNAFPTSPIPRSLSDPTHIMPSQVYGPEHLLRLFVKLPGLLARTDMPEKNLSVLLEQINIFLRYLAEKSPNLFPEDVYSSSLL